MPPRLPPRNQDIIGRAFVANGSNVDRYLARSRRRRRSVDGPHNAQDLVDNWERGDIATPANELFAILGDLLPVIRLRGSGSHRTSVTPRVS